MVIVIMPVAMAVSVPMVAIAILIMVMLSFSVMVAIIMVPLFPGFLVLVVPIAFREFSAMLVKVLIGPVTISICKHYFISCI